jgi:hypothetical protein
MKLGMKLGMKLDTNSHRKMNRHSLRRVIRLGLVTLVTVLAAASAPAMVDVSVNYNAYTGNPTGFTSSLGAICGGAGCADSTLRAASGLGFEARVSPPGLGFAFGLRYEPLQKSFDLTGVGSFKYNFTRTSLLVGYRLWDTLIYLGPIGTYGISNTSSFDYTPTGGATSTYTAGTATSYTLGFEGGVKLGLFQIGAEVGYSSLVGKDYKNGNTTLVSGGNSLDNIGMNGTYATIILGLTI